MLEPYCSCPRPLTRLYTEFARLNSNCPSCHLPIFLDQGNAEFPINFPEDFANLEDDNNDHDPEIIPELEPNIEPPNMAQNHNGPNMPSFSAKKDQNVECFLQNLTTFCAAHNRDEEYKTMMLSLCLK